MVLRFNMQKGDASLMKYVFSLSVDTGYFFTPRRMEARRDLFGLPLGSCYYHCFGRAADLYCIFVEDCVGGELGTILALGLQFDSVFNSFLLTRLTMFSKPLGEKERISW